MRKNAKRIAAFLLSAILIVCAFLVPSSAEAEARPEERIANRLHRIPGRICLTMGTVENVDMNELTESKSFFGIPFESIDFPYTEEEIQNCKDHKKSQTFYVITLELTDKSEEKMQESLDILNARDDVGHAFNDFIIYHPKAWSYLRTVEGKTMNPRYTGSNRRGMYRIPGKVCVTMGSIENVDWAELTEAKRFLGVPFESIDFPYDEEEIQNCKDHKKSQTFYVITFILEDKSQKKMNETLDILNAREDVGYAFNDFILYHYMPKKNQNANPGEPRDAEAPWAMERSGLTDASALGFRADPDITVALIDTGVDRLDHLEDNVLWNASYDAFTDQVGVPVPDVNAYGTHIANVLTANTDDVPFPGISNRISILPIKAVGADETVTEFEDVPFEQGAVIARAFRYAIDASSDIINYQWAMPDDLYGGISPYLSQYDGIVVLSSGCEYLEGDDGGLLPPTEIENSSAHHRKCDLPGNVIVTGTISEGDAYHASINYGSASNGCAGVDVASPLLVTGSPYNYLCTPESSTALVSGVCALLKGTATHKSSAEIAALIKNHSETVSSLTGKVHQGRVLNLPSIAAPLFSEARPAYSRGDVNGDGIINILDYGLCRRAVLHTVTLTEEQVSAADVNGNGIVDANDYLCIRRFILRTFYFAP